MLVYVTYELGRSLFYMQRVMAFAKTINTVPPADVKTALDQYAHDLHNSNPLIRNGAMIALRIATGWNLGTDTVDWEQWWEKQAPYWEYHRPVTNAPPTAPDWRRKIPSGLAPPPGQQ